MSETEQLRERIDRDALSGLHRVIPAFKDEHGGEPIDAYLTSAEIRKMLMAILQACKEEGLVFYVDTGKDLYEADVFETMEIEI